VNCANLSQVIDLYGFSSLSAFSVDNFVDIPSAERPLRGKVACFVNLPRKHAINKIDINQRLSVLPVH
jgi:hypothetical protein